MPRGDEDAPVGANAPHHALVRVWFDTVNEKTTPSYWAMIGILVLNKGLCKLKTQIFGREGWRGEGGDNEKILWSHG